MPPGLGDILGLTVSRASDNSRLRTALVLLTDDFCRLVAIHDGHGQVHEDEAVDDAVFETCLDLFHRLLSVVRAVNQLGQVNELP